MCKEANLNFPRAYWNVSAEALQMHSGVQDIDLLLKWGRGMGPETSEKSRHWEVASPCPMSNANHLNDVLVSFN